MKKIFSSEAWIPERNQGKLLVEFLLTEGFRIS